MWTRLFVAGALLFSGTAQASWYCSVECKQAGNIELDRIPFHASGTAYQDFEATCRDVHHGQFRFGRSECGYSYCVRFDQSTTLLTGSGSTLTEARQNARANCKDEGNYGWCGVGFYRQIGEYSCRQN